MKCRKLHRADCLEKFLLAVVSRFLLNARSVACLSFLDCVVYGRYHLLKSVHIVSVINECGVFVE